MLAVLIASAAGVVPAVTVSTRRWGRQVTAEVLDRETLGLIRDYLRLKVGV